MSLAEVLAAIPHRPPFLFVDEIVARGENTIVCRKTFRPEEYYFAGHYPERPLVPGVLLCEAAMQAGAILLASLVHEGSDRIPLATRMNDVRFKRVVRPSETIDIEVALRERLADAFFWTPKVSCGGKVAARLEFACTLGDKTA